MPRLSQLFDKLEVIALNSSQRIKNHHAELHAAVLANDSHKMKEQLDSLPLLSSKEPYMIYLNELREHFFPSAEKAQALKQQLNKAITAGRAEEIDDIIQNGGITLVNQPLNADHDDLPIQKAIATGDPEKIMAIAQYLSRKELEQPLDVNGSTLLHVALKNGYEKIALMIMAKQVDVNLADKHHTTPLHVAAENPALYYLAATLINKGADVNAKIQLSAQYEISVLAIAVLKENLPLVAALIKSGVTIDYQAFHFAKNKQENIPALHELMVKPVEERKQSIVKNGPTLLHAHQEQDSDPLPLQILLSHIYTEFPQQGNKIAHYLRELIKNDNANVIMPMLTLITQAIKAKEKDNDQSLQIIIADQTTLNPFMNKEGSLGYYDKAHTIYCAANQPVEMCVASLLHEFQHFSDKWIFGNTNAPYSETSEAHFKMMQQDVIKRIATLPSETHEDRVIKASFESILSPGYKEDERNAEFLVKVPEVIGLLGPEKGINWLETHQPALLAYYKLRFNKTCNAYIASATASYGNTHRLFGKSMENTIPNRKNENEKMDEHKSLVTKGQEPGLK